MAKLKNLANCKPSEFLRQTNRIRKAVSQWLSLTEISSIRKRQPVLSDDMSEEEKKKAIDEQTKANFNAILDSCLEQHPDETLEVLALASFVEPKDVDKYTVTDYISSFNELLENDEIISFFTSLVSWGQMLGLEG